jgi:3-methyladenine DNA glycosylase/8-oxoguanine DNA glycosylase
MAKQLKMVADLRVEVAGPFDFALTVAKPAGWHWSTPGEVFEDGTVWTGLNVAGRLVGLKLFSTVEGAVSAAVFASSTLSGAQLASLTRTVEHGLGKDQDLEAFYDFAAMDPILERVVRDRYGMRIGRLDELFGRVILTITLQMAQLPRSQQMMGDVLKLYGSRLAFDGKAVQVWPTPSRVAREDAASLRQKANLGYRAKLLSGAARYLRDNPMSIVELDSLPDEEALKKVRAIPGIGEYSAGIVLGRYAPIDAWSVIVMSELLLGRTPSKPRDEIARVNRLIEKRWGRWSWLAFAYILNDLDNLQADYNLTRLT